MYTDVGMEDGDDDYETSSKTTRRDAEKRMDRVKASAPSVHSTNAGIAIRVVRGSITDQQVLYFVV